MARNVRVVTGPRPTGEIERAQEFADALMARSLRPRGPEQRGPVQVTMSPWEGVAQLGEAAIAASSQKYARKLAEADQERLRAANEQLVGQLGGYKDAPRRIEDRAPMANFGQPTGAPIDLPEDMRVPTDKAEKLAAAIAGMDPGTANAALSGVALQQSLATPKYERVDLGDSIGVVDEAGNIVSRIPKGATPDAQMREAGADRRWGTPSANAKLSEQGAMYRHGTPSGSAQLGAQVSMRGQDIGAETARAGQYATADREAAKMQMAEQEKARAKAEVWNTYETARNGLMAGLAGAQTDPITGRLPAATAAQQVAEGSVAAMAPVLKQLFRVAGEGVFTDRDQQLLIDMVPKRTDLPAAREQKMANIDAIVRAKLGMPPAAPAAPQAPPVADEDSALIEQYLYRK
jgi:hypothetical protein